MAQFETLKPKIILAVGAHADDIDFGASGGIAKWAAEGAAVYYLVVTDGSKGSPNTDMTSEKLSSLREEEQQAAAKVVGAKDVFFLGYEDGALEVTQKLKEDIVRIIRQLRPDTVIVMDPTVMYSRELGFINHTDHRAAGQATLDAVYPLARDHLTFPSLYQVEQLEPHKVAHLLLINFDEQDFFVDITATMDTKIAALAKHESQIADMDGVAKMLRSRAELAGRHSGVKYAEGFVRLDLPG